MPRRLWRFLWENLGSLFLAFALAFAVWISAVVAADPNEERSLPRALELEIRNLQEGLVLIANLPEAVNVTLSAPTSLWDRLSDESDAVTAYIDLAELASGEHQIPIEIETKLSPVRVVAIDPLEVPLVLEPRTAKEMAITLETQGEVALGFQVEQSALTPMAVDVSGPQSLVAQVESVIASLTLADARESFSSQVNLQAVDADGNVLSGLALNPEQVEAQISIAQAGGYREVAVAVETIGQPAQGFRVIDISVEPPIVTLFSDDIQLIEGLPGFVSTQPLDLSNAEANITSRLALNLPDGVTVEGEQQNVEVVIGISPIESSIPLTIPVEVIGLAAGDSFEISPESANLILSGPLAVLESLAPGDVRLIVDVSDLGAGAHLLGPRAEILPQDVEVLSVTPSSVEVVIITSESP